MPIFRKFLIELPIASAALVMAMVVTATATSNFGF
jgi:hypothetical protein